MVPTDLISYFTTMATVGGTLVGLIFIAISIFPETTIEAKAPLERQTKVASSFTALLNPLIISLFALIPRDNIGYVALILGILDLLTNIVISIYLLRQKNTINSIIRKLAFIIGAFVLYIYEIVIGIRLLYGPGDAGAMEALNILLIIVYLYGVSRAWDVLGARQFQVTDWVEDVLANTKDQQRTNGPISDAPHILLQSLTDFFCLFDYGPCNRAWETARVCEGLVFCPFLLGLKRSVFEQECATLASQAM